MRLEDIALVTGGGSGIGRAAAHELAREGAEVWIVGRREAKLRETVELAGDLASRIHVKAADMRDRAAASAIVAAVESEGGRIDILNINHGLNVQKRKMAELDPAEWDTLIEVNATGVFNLIHFALPGMRRRGDGVIIGTSSVAGCRPSPLGGVAYSASKHAMTAMIRTISEEEKDSGVRLSVVSPGEVNTPILDERPVPVSAEHRAQILQPEDVAAAIVFIATLPPRAHVPDLVIKPTTQSFA